MNSRRAQKIVNQHRGELGDIPSLVPARDEFPDHKPLISGELFHVDRNEAGAFKWRGALVGAYALARAGAEHFVVPSAGNHARGAAIAARILDREVTIVVPTTAPEAKRQGIRELWTGDDAKLTVIEHGQTFDESLVYAREFADQHPESRMLHPYDDENVAMGQGTIVRDLLAQRPDTSRIVLPTGGGGLLAGVLGTLADLERTDVEVVATEAEGSDSLSRSLAVGEIVRATAPNKLYGGSAVQHVGGVALRAAQNYPGELRIVTVWDEDVDKLLTYYRPNRTTPLEPTSLVALAAAEQLDLSESNTVFIGTGHNQNPFAA